MIEPPSPPPEPPPSPASPPPAAADTPQARPDLVFRRVGEDWLLFDPRTQRVHVLNHAAALVWSFCSGDVTVEEMRAQVQAAFGGRAEGDPVAESLARFRAEGLLAG